MISASDFVHIHNHSQFSKFDGFSSVQDFKRDGEPVSGIVSTAKELGMKAVALTDHGTVAGAIEFLKTCREKGVKPIIGMEAYLCRNRQFKSKDQQPDGRKGNRHINIIAKNYDGFQNLCTLSHRASLEGYYYDPRLDIELLAEFSKGLIVTSACLGSIVNWNLAIDRYEKAKQAAKLFKDIFGDDFYLEVMYHGIDREAKIIPEVQRLAQELDIKIIATNDCHYLRKEDAEYHEVLMCMSSGRCIKDPKRIKFPYNEFYFKSAEEMAKIFGHTPSMLLNTLEIAEKCDYTDLLFVESGGTMKLPKFDIPPEFPGPYEYLKDLAWKGLANIELDKSEPHRKRLEQELSDIKLIWDTKRYDFSTYFLIVDDIMRFAREHGVAAGIRGSGYGSVLLKCLGIAEGVDPLEQELLWERFLGFDSKIFISEEDFGIKVEDYSKK